MVMINSHFVLIGLRTMWTVGCGERDGFLTLAMRKNCNRCNVGSAGLKTVADATSSCVGSCFAVDSTCSSSSAAGSFVFGAGSSSSTTGSRVSIPYLLENIRVSILKRYQQVFPCVLKHALTRLDAVARRFAVHCTIWMFGLRLFERFIDGFHVIKVASSQRDLAAEQQPRPGGVLVHAGMCLQSSSPRLSKVNTGNTNASICNYMTHV